MPTRLLLKFINISDKLGSPQPVLTCDTDCCHTYPLTSRYDNGTNVKYFIDNSYNFVNQLRYYAWDYRVLKKFARHYSTGDIIPEKLVESMQGAKKMFAGMELQQQVKFYRILFFSFLSKASNEISALIQLTKNEFINRR